MYQACSRCSNCGKFSQFKPQCDSRFALLVFPLPRSAVVICCYQRWKVCWHGLDCFVTGPPFAIICFMLSWIAKIRFLPAAMFAHPSLARAQEAMKKRRLVLPGQQTCIGHHLLGQLLPQVSSYRSPRNKGSGDRICWHGMRPL